MEGRTYKSNDSQMPLMDLAVKYCLKKDTLSHLRREKDTKSNKKIWEKLNEAKGKNNTRRLKQCSLSFNSMQT